jgi:hypothetical protein
MTMLPTAMTVVLVLCWLTDALHSYRMMTMPIYLNTAGSIKSSSSIYMSDAPKNKKKVILWMHRLII